MNRHDTKTLLKAARMIEREANVLRRSSTVPRSNPPVWTDSGEERRYLDMTRTVLKLRAMVMGDNP